MLFQVKKLLQFSIITEQLLSYSGFFMREMSDKIRKLTFQVKIYTYMYVRKRNN